MINGDTWGRLEYQSRLQSIPIPILVNSILDEYLTFLEGNHNLIIEESDDRIRIEFTFDKHLNLNGDK